MFSAEETTAQLYQDIAKPLVVSAVEGYNGESRNQSNYNLFKKVLMDPSKSMLSAISGKQVNKTAHVAIQKK